MHRHGESNAGRLNVEAADEVGVCVPVMITHGESRIAPLAGNGRRAGGRKSPRMLDSHSRSARTSDGDVQTWAGGSGSTSLVREVGS
ncbi:hypothetical protein L210DRAFT_981183 [Boletus edulis BED1]|uniref:Uncharacterized protein n=1 Tax=Boletus edulis BED1 TaxID=1328754 RepID=A0AAD4G7B6_BOLED|nr:hypothetical protein L210DRAFT_981183 [Boletus edulis BED1]